MAIQYPTQLVPLLFFIGYVLAAVISVGFAFYVIRYRTRQPSAVAFGAVGVCLGIWALGYVGRMLAPTLAGKLLWTQVSWIGVTLTPLAVLAFILIFTGRGDLLTRWRIVALTAIPVLTQLMLFTNVHHGLFYEEVWLHVEPTAAYIASRGGAYFYGVHIPYSWALYTVGTILLVQFAFSTKHMYRAQSIALVVGATIPWVVNGTFLAGVRIHPELDPTPVGFAVGMAIIGVAASRLEFLGLIPLARERVVEEMDDAIFVFDDRGRLVDHNPAATDFIERFVRTSPTIGSNAEDVLPHAVATHIDNESTARTPVEISLEGGDGADAWYLCRTETVGKPTYNGCIISLTDITEQKHRQASLEVARARVERDRDIKAAIQQLLVSTTIDRNMSANICQLLVEEHGFASAWIVSPDGSEPDHFTAQHGVDSGFRFESVTDGKRYDPVTSEAIESAHPVLYERDGSAPKNVTQLLKKCDVEAVYSIPLVHGSLSFGALTAVTTSPVTVLERTLLEEFADALAFKHHLHRQREALTTDRIIHIELQIGGYHVLSKLAAAVGPYTAYELVGSDETVPYLIESDADASDLSAAAESVSEIDAYDVVADRDETTVFRITVQPPTIGTIVRAYDGSIQSIRVEPDSVSVTIQFPPRTPIAKVATAVQAEWPETATRSRQNRSIDVERPSPFSTLTEKQENALRAAVVAGFFDRPQGANAGEVADAIGVSRSTFLHHLRAAERKVFSEAFDE